MNALYQRLKELDPNTFERLCFHLLKERYPGAEVRHVDGGAGDEGVDIFVGDLEVGTVVWQCKSFPNGIGDSQKAQIRDSLRRALRAVKLKRWVLCTSTGFTTKGYRWWQKLEKENSNHIELGLLSASDIVHLLLYHRSLQEQFFPEAIISVASIRSALARSSELTAAELAAISEDNIAQYF